MSRQKPPKRNPIEQIEFLGHNMVTRINTLPKPDLPNEEEAARQIFQEMVRLEKLRSEKKSFWTEDRGFYFNRETGRAYVPHHAAEERFVYSDSPTNCAVFGSEGCLDGSTLIENVPVAEWQGGKVQTIFGLKESSRAYLKGRAPLYRVKTRGGREITTTLQHRFLTDKGYWKELAKFSINDFIIGFDGTMSVADTIADIRYVKDGEYYDLTVPDGEHYLAHGLWNHNSGKSVGGIVKTLERLRRGMPMAMASPDLPHFKKSLWPEFQRWCPWDSVIPEHQYMSQFGWSPREPMVMGFVTGGMLQFGGMDNPINWEGSNLSAAYIDEARRLKTSDALKVLKGRVRIPGKNGEPPQFFVTTTKPRNTEHWLYEYFGPIKKDEDGNIDDPFYSFKKDSMVVNLHVRDNLVNLSQDFMEQRSQGLTDEEIALLVDNEWVDLDEQEAFLPSIALWDSCKVELPPLDDRTPIVLALDAAEMNDTFFATACSWHPEKGRDVTALRYTRVWEPKNGMLLDFDVIEKEITEFIQSHRVVLLTYDAALIRQMCNRLSQFVWAREFSQQRDRLIADKGLLDSIMQRTIVHDGSHATLRKHLMNADRKTDTDSRKLRIVKRSPNLKIDGAVSLSMNREWASSPTLNLGI